MTNPLQKHIADSLEEFEEELIGENGYLIDNPHERLEEVKDLAKKYLLQLLSIARGEVEKKKNTVILGTEESSQAYKHKTDGYHRAIKDVLDLLTIKEND